MHVSLILGGMIRKKGQKNTTYIEGERKKVIASLTRTSRRRAGSAEGRDSKRSA